MNLDRRRLLAFAVALAASVAYEAPLALSFAPLPQERLPDAAHNLRFETPVTVWDEALPLGNGLLGALVWGDGTPLKISLDRTDLWDLRPVPQFRSEDYSYSTLREWVREGRIDDIHRLYDDPYGNAGPTKIPAGRIELTIDGLPPFNQTWLDLVNATAAVEWAGGARAMVMVHATRDVGVIEIVGTENPTVELIPPAFGGEVNDPAGPGKISAGDLASLGYEPPEVSRGDDFVAYSQQGWKDFSFSVAVVWQRIGESWIAAWSIATRKESPKPLDLALQRARSALRQDFNKVAWDHLDWWRRYWSEAWIELPNPILERQWTLETYKFGAAARRDTPPITLQGPWTADDGRIPPWKGDYHHDLNTELSYWPAYSGNHIDGAEGFVNWLFRTQRASRNWSESFFGLPGLDVPMCSDLRGRQIGGWVQYTHSATTGAWLAHHFWLHWRYTMDRKFLANQAWPYLRDVAIFLEAVTEKQENGVRTLPLSSSPEINDDRLDAWFPSITNYDLALCRWLFGATAELAEELGDTKQAEHWRSVLAELPELAKNPETGRLLVAEGYPLTVSHRHFSHLLAIHPLGLIRRENGEEDRRTIRAALEEMKELGTDWWCGYSFAWQASIAARAGDGELAERALEIFSTAFCLRNGFHCNGDQSGLGFSKFRYRPFTLEGNFAAAAAVQEMLLQSYSGVIRVFPAIPESWKNAAFHTLRAEGALLVSATRKDGEVTRVEIFPAFQGDAPRRVRLEDPFAGAEFVVELVPDKVIEREGGELRFDLTADEGISLVLASEKAREDAEKKKDAERRGWKGWK